MIKFSNSGMKNSVVRTQLEIIHQLSQSTHSQGIHSQVNRSLSVNQSVNQNNSQSVFSSAVVSLVTQTEPSCLNRAEAIRLLE